MRSASCFFLSLALHTAALVSAVSVYGPSRVQLIEVTILPMKQKASGAGGQGAAGTVPPRAGSKSAVRTPPGVQPEVESTLTSSPDPRALPIEAPAKPNDGGVSLVSAIASTTVSNDTATSGSVGNGVYGSVAAMNGTGIGISGVGSGSSGKGFGRGDGQGSSEPGIVLTQARYRDAPKPDYPESARREGREGRVLLRVLVDDQGRSKQVEINSSSGNDALDRAAAEAIKRWRFHPARYGDQPVESWLRIPIEFRLADANPDEKF